MLHTIRVGVDLLCVKNSVAQTQGDNKAGSLAEFAFYADSAMMQLYDALGQRQSDARTAFPGIGGVNRIYLIETVEYLVDFFCIDAASCIFYADHNVVFLFFHAERNGIFLLRMLNGIG